MERELLFSVTGKICYNDGEREYKLHADDNKITLLNLKLGRLPYNFTICNKEKTNNYFDKNIRKNVFITQSSKNNN